MKGELLDEQTLIRLIVLPELDPNCRTTQLDNTLLHR